MSSARQFSGIPSLSALAHSVLGAFASAFTQNNRIVTLDKASGAGVQPGGQRIVAVSAPDGIAIATPQSATLTTGTNIDQVAVRDTNQTTGRRWIHNVKESISLVVSGTQAKIKNTFKIIAAAGNVQIQAQSGEIEATADRDLTITSVNGKVIIKAPQEILLAAGGGCIRIGANIEIHNPGTQSMKAAHFDMNSPTSMHPPMPELPAATPTPQPRRSSLAGFRQWSTQFHSLEQEDASKEEHTDSGHSSEDDMQDDTQADAAHGKESM